MNSHNISLVLDFMWSQMAVCSDMPKLQFILPIIASLMLHFYVRHFCIIHVYVTSTFKAGVQSGKSCLMQ